MALIKKCSKCNIEKLLHDFNKHNGTKSGYQQWCSDCMYQYRLDNKRYISQEKKKYYNKKREEILKYKKEYYQNNKEQIAKKDKEYYQNNKKYLFEKANKRSKLRKKRDLSYKLACSLRTRLGEALKGNFKSGSAVKDLGCSVEELKQYLESKFQSDMNWDNWARDGWHIDHIKPLSSFDLTDRKQFLEAAHYTNLQPMWAKENILKRDSRAR